MATEKTEIWSVSQLTRRVKNLLEAQLGRVWLSGEISNWRVSPAGHAYFNLKDEHSQIDAVMFRGKMQRTRFAPGNGLEVTVFGQLTVYERRGNYQIICEEMQPKGLGALQLAFERLKKKLAAEGLFDDTHKKPLPMLPRRIGVVTSPTGAAIRDILQVINRRFANVHVLVYPARVQGEEAAPEIAAGIAALDQYGVDVMIVGRGGGSLEDLWPFNEEVVVRAVYHAQTPIISAVGHEIDFSLCDFAADVRAPTPSAAAELVVQERAGLMQRLDTHRIRLGRALRQHLENTRYRVQRAGDSFVFRRPEELFRERRQRCDDLRLRLEQELITQAGRARVRLDRAGRGLDLLSPRSQLNRTRERLLELHRRLLHNGNTTVARARARLEPARGQLKALSPVAVLERGYALAVKHGTGELIRDARQLHAGDMLDVRLGKGAAEVAVKRIKDRNDGNAQL